MDRLLDSIQSAVRRRKPSRQGEHLFFTVEHLRAIAVGVITSERITTRSRTQVFMHIIKSRITTLALTLFVGVTTLFACSVPVFRYALDNWPADAYQAIVYHRDPLTKAEQALLRDLSENGKAGKLSANVKVQTVDVGGNLPPDVAAHWRAQENRSLPLLVIRYPLSSRIPIDVWSGPLNATTISTVLESPARREVAKRIISGDCAAWVFLDSGDRANDNAAHSELTARLKELQSRLKIPKADPLDAEKGLISIDQKELKVKFSVLRVSINDPKEQILIRQLLGTESDLWNLKQPMAFPVFGRGRALYALVGKGINRDTVSEACSFLVGSCSCQVKEQNPGVDLLIATDWGGAIKKSSGTEIGLPPLSEIPELKKSKP